MSMIGYVLGLTPAQISAMREMPSLTGYLVVVAEEEEDRKVGFDEWVQRLAPEQRKQREADRAAFEASEAAKEFQARIAEARGRVAALGPIEPVLCLEKLWDILHYLFTGHMDSASAPGDLLMTGEALGEDVGYGPARLHSPTATREFGGFLAQQDLARLQARVDLREMTRLGVYPTPIGRGPDAEYEKELRDEVGIYFPRLRDYLRKMFDKGNGLLVWLS
jgi:hypothetical protein